MLESEKNSFGLSLTLDLTPPFFAPRPSYFCPHLAAGRAYTSLRLQAVVHRDLFIVDYVAGCPVRCLSRNFEEIQPHVVLNRLHSHTCVRVFRLVSCQSYFCG